MKKVIKICKRNTTRQNYFKLFGRSVDWIRHVVIEDLFNRYLNLRRTASFSVFSSFFLFFFLVFLDLDVVKISCLNRDSYHYIPATKVIPIDYVIIREAMETIGRIERYNDFPIETK